MRLIAKHQGGDADTSRDREYTDWDDLTRFVDEFLAATSQQESGHSAAAAAGPGRRDPMNDGRKAS